MSMETLRTENHLLLTDNVKKNLSQNRIVTVIDFLQEDVERLSNLVKLSLPQVLSLKADLFSKYSAPLENGVSLLLPHNEGKRFLSTGISSLDTIIGGGLPIGYISELCGLAGTGKTQLCFQIAINCVKNKDNTVLFIDTKGDFTALRIQKILQASGHSNKDMALIMLKLKVIRVWAMEEVIELLVQIRDGALKFEKLSLVVIDSLPCLMFQFLGDESKEGLKLLNVFTNNCRKLCKVHKISIMCVNIETRWVQQDVADEDDFVAEPVRLEKRHRCLGKYWQHIPSLAMLTNIKRNKINDEIDIDYRINVTVIKSTYGPSDVNCSVNLGTLGIA